MSEFVGKIPARTEITVLPADPDRPTLGWTVKIYSGPEIHLLGLLDRIEGPITERQALQPGVMIAVPGLMGGYHRMEVKSETYAETPDGKMGAFLAFGEDERNCWVCSCLINTKVFDILKATPR